MKLKRKVQQSWKFRFWNKLLELYTTVHPKIENFISRKVDENWVEDWDTFLPTDEVPIQKPFFTEGFFASIKEQERSLN